MRTLMMRRPLSSRGQVVIPRDIRVFLGMNSGGTVVFEVRNNEVILKTEGDHAGFLDDFLNTPKLAKSRSAQNIKRMIMEQYDEKIH